MQAKPAQPARPARIDRDEVLRIARLAKLDLSGPEVDKMVHELGAILEHVDRMSRLDVSEIEPMSHAVDLAAPLRDDVPAPCLSRDEALRTAPKTEGGAFVVPRILDE